MEYVYEGYLFHYRQSRVVATVRDRETALLAGDVFYARGLWLVAARGDADAVGLLSRLMGACSYLRSADSPYAADDALWAWTMAGLAALRRGAESSAVALPFDLLDSSLAEGAAVDIAALTMAAASLLPLPDAVPILAHLEALAGEAHVSAINPPDRR